MGCLAVENSTVIFAENDANIYGSTLTVYFVPGTIEC